MKCLTFENEENALTAINQININMNYPLYGTNVKTGEINTEAIPTTTWDIVNKCYGQDKWYISKPDQEYMTNIENYTEEDFNDNWKSQIEE